MNWIIREHQKRESKYNAGSKARSDIDLILSNKGYKSLNINSELDESQGKLKKVYLQYSRFVDWQNCIKLVEDGDCVVIQYPVRNHTILLENTLKSLKKKNVKIILIVHDLESLRLAISESIPPLSKIRFKLEEVSALKYADNIIVHNLKMSKAINAFFNVPMEKMIPIEIFDYLYDETIESKKNDITAPIIIAGNLSRVKSGYIYNLPKDVNFELFGANFDEQYRKDNIAYKGIAEPDKLPGVLKGSFGLVWDGPSAKTCEGIFGEYLRYNNPHKASLYLAAGLPLIVWEESALANFVKNNQCGICVSNLGEMCEYINNFEEQKYQSLLTAVESVGKRIRTGEYIKGAIAHLDL